MKGWMQTLAIARREFAALWVTPMGYGVAALFCIGASLMFLGDFASGSQASLWLVYTGVSWLLAALIPAVSMRLLSEEWRSGTLELLASSPVTDTQIVLGKWLGAVGYLGTMLLLLWPIAWVLMLWGRPDGGMLVSGWIGLWLLAGLYLAIGLWISAMTSSGLLCYMASLFVIGMVTLLTALLPFAAFVGPEMRDALFYMNVPAQYGDFARGVIDPTTVSFFITGIVLLLFVAVQSMRLRRQVASRRWEPVVSSGIAIVVVVLLNIIVANETARLMRVLPYGWQGWVRIDMTSGQSRSLSPRTLASLNRLQQPVRLISTLGQLDDATRDVHERLNLLARSSDQLTAKHLRVTDENAIADLRRDVRQSFAAANASAVETLSETEHKLRDFSGEMSTIVQDLESMLQEDKQMQIRTRQAIALSLDAMSKTAKQITDQVQAFSQGRSDDLPDYAAQLQQYQRILNALRQGVLPRFVEQMEQVASDSKATGSARDQAILLSRRSDMISQRIRSLLSSIQSVKLDRNYQAMRQALGSGAVVLVLGEAPGQVEALSIQQAESGRWQISEDVLASAITRVGGGSQTLGEVVFVSVDGKPVAAEGGTMRYWAARVASAGYRVRQQSLDQLAKQLQENASVVSTEASRVYVFPPIMPGAMDETSTLTARNQQAALLQHILNGSGSAILFVTPDPTLRAVESDRMFSVLESIGVRPQADRILVWLRPLGENRDTISTQIVVTQFNTQNPITSGLGATPAMIAGACDLKISDATKYQTRPLIEVTDPRVWPTDRMTELAMDIQAGQSVEPAAYTGPYVVATHSQAKGSDAGGLVTIASGLFGYDLITSNADASLSPSGIGSAATNGAAYPANLEVLVNSVFVLTGEPTQTAAGESIFATRRVGSVSSSSMFLIRVLLLVVMPGAIVGVGTGVWYLRRRG